MSVNTAVARFILHINHSHSPRLPAASTWSNQSFSCQPNPQSLASITIPIRSNHSRLLLITIMASSSSPHALSSSPESPQNHLQNHHSDHRLSEYHDANIRNFAPVARIMKGALPDNAKIAKEAKECMQECVSEFISFITSEGQ